MALYTIYCMSLNRLDREYMSTRRKVRCTCPCGYGFEKVCSEDDAIVMVQKHFNRFHMDMLPFGITTTEARTLLTVVNDFGKTKPIIQPRNPIDKSSPFGLKKPTGQMKRKNPQILTY